MGKKHDITVCALSRHGLMPSQSTREKISGILLKKPKKGERVTILAGSNYNQPAYLLDALREHPDLWIVLVEPEEPDETTRKLLFIGCNEGDSRIADVLAGAPPASDSWRILLDYCQPVQEYGDYQ